MTETENEQNESINRMRESRDEARVKKALSLLNRAAVAEENIMPHVLEAARSYATLGEIIICLKEAMGVYIEPAIF
ncbi:MAG: hypothetical protein IIC40_05790 [Candidatus Marinimicrobia bacterium]|nr:hypothetical protein [Candidatus Neomarinimicrobiota bacterium]